MKKYLLLIFIFYFSLFILKAQGTWSARASLPSYLDATFAGISGFSIGDYGYAGLGENNSAQYSDTLWQFDPSNNSWAKKTAFPGSARISPASFVIGSKAYIVTGSITNFGKCVTECWEYDAKSNKWTQRADFPDSARFGAVGFSIGSKGYVGTGFNGNQTKYYKDFYSYDTATNTWTKIADFGGIGRGWACGFALTGKGYVCFGQDSIPSWHIDIWEYNPNTNTWTQKSNYPGAPTYIASGFVIGGNIYVGSCQGSGNRLLFDNRFWKYNPGNDSWNEVASNPLPAKLQATAFSIQDTGYLGFGFDSLGQIVNLFDKFSSDSSTGISNLIYDNIGVQVFPNPFNSECSILLPSANTIPVFTLYDVNGNKIESNIQKVNATRYTFNRHNLDGGMYFLKIIYGNHSYCKKLLISD